MTVSICNAETTAAIRLLAACTGLSSTEATDRAVRGEPRRLNARSADETPQARAATGTGSWPTDADLYDEDGSPR